jgi:hypothetical protein
MSILYLRKMKKDKISFSGEENINSIKITLLTEILAYQKTSAEILTMILSHLGGKDPSSLQIFYNEVVNQKYSEILEFLYAEFGNLPDFLKKRNIE